MASITCKKCNGTGYIGVMGFVSENGNIVKCWRSAPGFGHCNECTQKEKEEGR